MELKVWWDQSSDDPTVVRTAADLDRLIDEARKLGYPVLLQLLDAADPCRVLLDVGLDGERGVLHCSGEGCAIDYYSSTASDAVPAERVLHYYMSSDHEFPRSAEHSVDIIRQAAHEYLTTDGARPTIVGRQPAGVMDALPPYREPAQESGSVAQGSDSGQ